MTDTNQPYVEPTPPQRALVMMAHPDDVEFLLGGTIAQWIRAGTVVRYVLATRGDAGSHEPGMTREKLALIREAEQLAAAEVFGVESVVFFDYHDGEVVPDLTLRRQFVREIRRFKPDVVVCFDPATLYIGNHRINHPDHRATGQAVLDAVAPAAAMPLNFPDLGAEGLEPHPVREVYLAMPAKPDTWINISDTIDLKFESLFKHVCQFEGNHDRITKMLREWGEDAGREIGVAYAEAFRRIILVREEA